MKHTDPKTLPTVSLVETETEAKCRRFRMLIADIEASETYEHCIWLHFCGTPACLYGHLICNRALMAEATQLGLSFDIPRGGQTTGVSLESLERAALFLGISTAAFLGCAWQMLHDGTKAGVLAYLRSRLAEMEG